MSLASRLTALVQAIGADVKKLNEVAMLSPVDAASTGNVNIASAPATTAFDDETGASWMTGRVLLHKQTNPIENGIWLYNTQGAPLVRASDALKIKAGQTVYVRVGKTYGGKMFVSTRTAAANEQWGFAPLPHAAESVAEPCMKAYTAQQGLTNVILDGSFDGERVLLTAQTNKSENGVYYYDSSAEVLIRVAGEVYTPGRLFPVVAQSNLDLDTDWANPQIWACTEIGGSEGYTFSLISGGGGTSGASTPLLRARVYLGDSTFPATVAAPAIAWQTEEADTGNFWNPAQPTRLTAPEAGLYIVTATVKELARTAGPRGAALRRDGVGWMDSWEDHALATEAKTQNLMYVGWLDAGQYFEVISIYPPATFDRYAGFNIAKIGSGSSTINPARRIKGRVNADGTIASGTGFTVTKVSTGLYQLNFSPAFGAPPVPWFTPGPTQDDLTYKFEAAPTVSAIRVFMLRNGVATDMPFSFGAEDPGLGLEATMDVEAWRVVGAAGQPAFQNAWAVAFGTVGFRKLPTGEVVLKGCIVGGTVGAVPIFTLPEGYRPKQETGFVNSGNGAFARGRIMPNGEVQYLTGSNQTVFLDPIRFFTD